MADITPLTRVVGGILKTRTLEGLYGKGPFQGAAARGPLVKGLIRPVDRLITDRDTRVIPSFRFQYNPAELTLRRTLEIGSLDSPGVDHPSTYFVSAKPDEISFNLLLEAKTYEGREDLERKYAEGIVPDLYSLYSLTVSQPTLGALRRVSKTYASTHPPKLSFSLGPMLIMPVWISQLEFHIQEWNSHMIPNRARVEVKMVSRGGNFRMDSFLDTVNQWALKSQNQAPRSNKPSGFLGNLLG
jgi:hypothetical protein